MVVAVKQRYKLKSNSQLKLIPFFKSIVVAVKQRYKLKSNSQHWVVWIDSSISCCCKAKIQT